MNRLLGKVWRCFHPHPSSFYLSFAETSALMCVSRSVSLVQVHIFLWPGS
jgi:hypothetical protein